MDKIILTPQTPIVLEVMNKDTKLKKLIEQVGDIELTLDKNYFSSLVQSIIGQQLSMKAADSIWKRVVNLLGEVNPSNILNCVDESLREAGMSKTKIIYVKDLAQKVKDGLINIEKIDGLSDEEIIKELTQVKGIGQWTAEMFLIFSLGRIDVFSIHDLGIKKAVQWLYNLPELPKKDFLIEFSNKFSPYRTVATLYLWGGINKGII
ncbi:MAG: DNA-3-methyladenine glycosylase [Clostridiales bacterium]|nr:DNA-3-methyladenine glycosylase [Clostridiales bacterium]